MNLNAAQVFVLDLVREPKVLTYKAPHAMRGTPSRPRFKRNPRMVFSKAHDGMIPARRLFKGHRI